MQQYKAGYILQSVHERLQTEYGKQTLAGLLDWLSTFDVITTMNLERARAIHPLLAVAHNLLVRGTPTLPSVWLEEQFAHSLKQTQRTEPAETGEIRYAFTGESPSAKELFQALHPIVPKVRAGEFGYDFNDVDSRFERDFVLDYCSEHPHLAQLLQKQRPLDTLVWEARHGRVDFSLEIPYWQEHERINKFKNAARLRRRKSYIVETDGADYHSHHIDSARDFATQAMGHKTSRITESDAYGDARKFLKKLSDENFIRPFQKNFSNEGYDQDLSTLSTLQPFAIARIQYMVLQFLMSKHWLEADVPVLRLALLERDIPAGALAINDLLRTFQHLQALASDEFPPLPQIVCTCFNPQEAINPDAFDLIIDHSVLRRAGIFAEDRKISGHSKVLQLRTAHFVDEQTHTSVISAKPVRYSNLGQMKENGHFEPDEEMVRVATVFLQDIFRKQAFREGQLPILNRAFQRKSVIGLLPTGGGKSLTYQLAALLQPGITVVVDPIRSLMKDQDRGLRKVLIDKTAFLNSSLSTSERVYIEKDVFPQGQLQFLFVSPERFVIQKFRDTLAQCGHKGHYCVFAVIDEAHCVSEWGHDFRVPYLNLGVNAQEYCPTWDKQPVPLFGLTATASFDVLADIERELQIREDDGHAIVRAENTVRDEINYQIVGTPANLPVGAAATVQNAKKAVGEEKQAAAFKRIAQKQATLAVYNHPNAIRRSTDQTVQSYLDEATLTKLRAQAEASGYGIEECYFRSKLKRLHYSDVQHAFEREESMFHYGLLVFLPYTKGSLGILGNGMFSNSDYTNPTGGADLPLSLVKATDDLIGFFMGSSDSPMADKTEKQSFAHMDRFVIGENSIMLATKAFGMGIDKPNIRHTMHLNLPASIEGFVQEAGRAGRDGKVALSTIFFNDAKFLVHGKPYHVDADVLDYFHQRSFKGQMKEQAMVYELRNRIALPPIQRSMEICWKLENIFEGYSGWNLSVWGHARLYLNVDELMGHNYINLVNGLPHADDMDIEVLHELKKLLHGAPLTDPAGLEAWLNELVTPITDPTGIEQQLRDLELGQKGELVVYFTNEYYSPKIDGVPFVLNPAHLQLVKNQALVHEIPALSLGLYSRLHDALKNQWPLDKYLAAFDLDEATKERILDPNSAEASVRKFQRAYYAGRNKEDTDKAIYRLTCIGVIDTYTIDYLNKCYHLYFTKQPEGTYFENLKTFLARYTSIRQAEGLVNDLREENEAVIQEMRATELDVCLSFLTNYIYDNIRLKRERAMKDMLALCRNAIQIPDPIEQNLFIKDEIYYYFNAKFSKPGVTELIKGTELSISLLDDVNEDVFDTGTLVEKYLDIVESSEVGGFVDNIKHLRGSTIRLLRSFPDNAALMILKSFSLFALSNALPNLLPEAQDELINGLLQWRRQSENEAGIRLFTEMFRKRLDALVDQQELREQIQKALDTYYLEYSADWLHRFNNKLLEAYD